jgi:hypothetical protein
MLTGAKHRYRYKEDADDDPFLIKYDNFFKNILEWLRQKTYNLSIYFYWGAFCSAIFLITKNVFNFSDAEMANAVAFLCTVIIAPLIFRTIVLIYRGIKIIIKERKDRK